MEFKQIEMFVALAEERNVHRAAHRVFRSQPAVSMAIAKLEEEVGSSLFLRRDHFRLTRIGETLYRYALALLQLRNDADAALKRALAAGDEPTGSPHDGGRRGSLAHSV